MERTMRRHQQALSAEVCEEILRSGSSGVLALCGEDGPYAVPLSYVLYEGKLIFHCAKAGHKLECIRYDDRASFCVIDQDEVKPELYTSYFRSVIAFGRVREVEDEGEIIRLMTELGMKYGPGHRGDTEAKAGRHAARTCVLVMEIARMTGKEASALAEERKKGV